jgi:hypothetical protein
MNIDLNILLSQVKAQLEEACASKASDLLQDPDTRLVDGAPTKEEVKTLLPTLKARLENSERTGKLVYGLEQVIASLAASNPSEVVIGYGFISPRAAGNIYLSRKDQVLGATIVDR